MQQKVQRSRKLLTKRNSKNIYIPNKGNVMHPVKTGEWVSIDLSRGAYKGNKGSKKINKQLGQKRARPSYNKSNNVWG